MSDYATAYLGIGFLAGTITAMIVSGVFRKNDIQRQSGDDYHTIDCIPYGDRNRRGNNRLDKQSREERIREEARELGIKLKEGR